MMCSRIVFILGSRNMTAELIHGVSFQERDTMNEERRAKGRTTIRNPPVLQQELHNEGEQNAAHIEIHGREEIQVRVQNVLQALSGTLTNGCPWKLYSCPARALGGEPSGELATKKKKTTCLTHEMDGPSDADTSSSICHDAWTSSNQPSNWPLVLHSGSQINYRNLLAPPHLKIRGCGEGNP